MSATQIQQFYSGQTVFLTGATGFVGTLLLEKILRVTDVRKVYILVRTRKSKTPEERIKAIFDCVVFDNLKKIKPKALEKVAIISGDLDVENNGISKEDVDLLVREVSVVIHAAASIKFNDPLGNLTNTNVRSVKDMADLAHKMKKLEAFVYVSTAYSNCTAEEAVIEEKVYPAPIDPEKLFKVVKYLDKTSLDLATPGILGKHPNSYVFTKILAENMAVKYPNLPVAIFRPGIIIPTLKEPIVGWANSMFTFFGLCVAIGSGIVHVVRVDGKKRIEIVAADYVVNGILASAWNIANECKTKTATKQPEVYNFVPCLDQPLAWAEYTSSMMAANERYPSAKTIWYPFCIFATNPLFYDILHILLHVVPAYILDTFLVVMQRKPLLRKTCDSLYKGMKATSFFSSHEWLFQTDNVKSLWSKLSEEDKKMFYFDLREVCWTSKFDELIKHTRKWILKESDSTLSQARFLFKIFKVLHYTVVTILLSLSLMLIYKLLLVAL